MMNFQAVGKRIRAARKARGLTQEKFAELIDVAPVYVSRIETGAARPSLVLIEKISALFDMEESELMFGTASDDAEAKALLEKISALNQKKRVFLEHMIDELSAI